MRCTGSLGRISRKATQSYWGALLGGSNANSWRWIPVSRTQSAAYCKKAIWLLQSSLTYALPDCVYVFREQEGGEGGDASAFRAFELSSSSSKLAVLPGSGAKKCMNFSRLSELDCPQNRVSGMPKRLPNGITMGSDLTPWSTCRREIIQMAHFYPLIDATLF